MNREEYDNDVIVESTIVSIDKKEMILMSKGVRTVYKRK